MHKLIVTILAFLMATPAYAGDTTKSYAFDLGGIATALVKSQQVIGGQRGLPALEPANDFQRAIVPLVPDYAGELTKFLTAIELKVFASFNPAEINGALKDAGSRLRVDFNPPDEFAVVSILNVAPQFVVPGEIGTKDEKTGQMTYFSVGSKHAAFRMKTSTHKITFRKVEGEPEPLIVLDTQNGDQALLLRSDQRPNVFTDKEAMAAKMFAARTAGKLVNHFTGAYLPMTSLEQEVNISDLEKLQYKGTRWEVSKALQQVRFLMDPNGVTVKTETVVVNTSRYLSVGPNYYSLDGSFYVVVLRPGMTKGYHSSFVGTDDFKVPESYKVKLPEDYPFKD